MDGFILVLGQDGIKVKKMKIRYPIFLLHQTAFIFLLLAGCKSTPPAPRHDTLAPVEVITKTPTEVKPTFAPPPVYSPVPTANSEEESQMINLLQLEECVLPCYLGITPGKTTLQEARKILKELKAGYTGNYQRRDGSTEYAYDLLQIGHPLQGSYSPTPGPLQLYIFQRISLISKDSIVQYLEAGVSTRDMFSEYRDIWRRYSIAGIFLQLGAPDQIYLDKFDPLRADYTYGQRVWAVYEQKGVVVELYGTGKENNVCPQKEASLIDLRLSLYNPFSGLDIYSGGRVPPTRRDVYLPIEDVLGITALEFYNQVISNPSVCFQTQ